MVGCVGLDEAKNTPIVFLRNVPLIEVEIAKSEPLLFLVDTGVDPSVIDAAVARRLGLPVDETKVGKASGTGDGAGLAVMQSSIVGLSVSGREYPPIEALAADLSSFGQALGTDLAGILGYSFFKNRVVRIDYRTSQIVFANAPENLPPLSPETKMQYRLPLVFNSKEDQIPVFDILVRGEAVTVSLDTGKSAGIEFYKPVADRLKIAELCTDAGVATRLGAQGNRRVTTGILPFVKLGPFTIEDAAVSFSGKIPDGESRRDGNAGNAFLQSFVVTLDYKNMQLIFER